MKEAVHRLFRPHTRMSNTEESQQQYIAEFAAELKDKQRKIKEEEANIRQEIIDKEVELEEYRAFKQVQLNGLARERSNLKAEERKIHGLEVNEILDHIKRDIDIGDTVSIIGRYTKFKSKHSSQTSGVREIDGYNKHKFGVVYLISLVNCQGNDQTRVHFTTDSGIDTYRDPKRLRIHYGERGTYLHHKQACKFEY